MTASPGPCPECNGRGQIDVGGDHYFDWIDCVECDATGLEPHHDTSEPPRDRLLLGELQHARIWASIHKGWGLSLDRDREFHRATMRRVIGEPVLTELSVAETFARARAAMPFDMGVYANQLLRGMAA